MKSKLYETVETIEGNSGRFYIHPDTGKKYPSVTTVLSFFKDKGIEKWKKKVGEEEAARILRTAGIRGTEFHNYAENYVLGYEKNKVLKNYFLEHNFNKIRPHLDKNLTKVHFTEQAIFHEELEVAGRIDLFGQWLGRDKIIDFKTARKEKELNHIYKYFMQASVYADSIGIDDFVILIAPEGSPQAQIFSGNKTKYLPLFTQLRNKYKEVHNI